MHSALNSLPKNPKILFITPDRGLSGECIVHQGISAMAAYLLENGIESHGMLTSLCDDEFIISMVQQYSYKFIGFYITSDNSSIQYVHSLIQKIKAVTQNVVFIAGGPHATLGADELLVDIPQMDICVQGEGEETCVELLSGISWELIKGITFRRDTGIVHNPARVLLPAAKLPMPLRNIYFNPKWNSHSLSTSRGCPNNCQFCIGHKIFGRTIRFKLLEKIALELQWLYDNEDCNLVISINDDMFNMKRDRTLALMDLFRKYPFRYFPRGMRADRLDAETAKAMHEANVVGTSIGIESADNDALKAMCKGETIEDIERGIHHLRDNGICIVAQFMIGNIGDTLETVKKTIAFAVRHKFEGINMSCTIPFPGTALREYVLKNNLLLKEPYQAAQGIVNGNTTIFFETPMFPLEDRVKAVQLAIEAGLLVKK